MRILIKYLAGILFLPIWVLQLLVPRKKNIWIFGVWYGHRFSDNSKYLYLYIKENRPEIKPVWITRDKKIRDKIKREDGCSYLTWSLKSCYYSLIAKNIIVSSGKTDVNRFFINGANWIQLWHGNPMKKIGLDDKFSSVNSFFHRQVVPTLFPFFSELNYNYVASNAAIFSDKMASAFNISLKYILETGCPRNDVFFSDEEDIYNKNVRDRFKGCKIVYYLPTFRNFENSKTLFNISDYNQDKLELFLEKENLVFINKGHFVDNKINDLQGRRLINLSDDGVEDINVLLKDADCLVTDYSGAYFDFLLTQKPIIFAAFDLSEYLTSSREMYFNYEEAVAGPIIENWEGLLNSLKALNRTNSYTTILKEKNILFNKFHDNNNSKRTFEAINRL